MDCALHEFERREQAVMDVGQVNDAQAFLRRGETAQPDVLLSDFGIGAPRLTGGFPLRFAIIQGERNQTGSP